MHGIGIIKTKTSTRTNFLYGLQAAMNLRFVDRDRPLIL